jgi:CubicO group peptidase (beta-lactamase class C family)
MSAPGWSGVFEEWMRDFVAERKLPGVSVGVAEQGRDVYFQGFGLADREEQRAISPDTIYGIGSITKSFTSLAVMQLAEAGRLDLDAPVTAKAPELAQVFGERAEGTTLRHFMSHATGMPPLPVLMAAMRTSLEADPDAAEDLREVDAAVRMDAVNSYDEHIDLLARLPFPWIGPPGRYFSYSNDCYGLLGLVIERASGVPYERYVEEHILRPAGLSRTVFDAGALAGLGDVAMSYIRRPSPKGEAALKPSDGPPEAVRAPAWWSAPAMTAAGFLKSSVRDLLRYIEIYQGDGTAAGTRILGPEGIGRMTTQTMAFTPNTGYGYGLALDRYAGLEIVQHSGGLKAISAFVLTVPAERLSVAVLINLGGEGAGRVGMAVVNAIMGRDPAASAPIPAEVALPAERSLYVGKYHSGEAVEDLEVEAAGGGLVLVSSGGKRQRMQPVGDGAFVVGEPPERSWVTPLMRDGKVFAVQAGSRIWPRHELWDEVGYPNLRAARSVSA